MQRRLTEDAGFLPVATAASPATFALSAANSWLAMGIIVPEAKTLNEVRVYATAVAGTLGANDLVCAIYDDNGGQPGSQLSSTNVVSSVPTGAGAVNFTGLTQALAAHTMYWLVFKNVNGTPASNNATIRSFAQTANDPYSTGQLTTYGWAKRQTTDAGASWATSPVASGALCRLKFSSGFGGYGYYQNGNTPVLHHVYGARMAGSQFVAPPDVTLRVSAPRFAVSKVGTPTGNLEYRLYAADTLVGTSAGSVTPAQAQASPLWITLYFATPVELTPGETYRAVIVQQSSGGDNLNYYRNAYYDIYDDADSKALMSTGLLGQFQLAYYNGAWSIDSTRVIPFGLILDTDDPVEAESGGGGSSNAVRSRVMARGLL